MRSFETNTGKSKIKMGVDSLIASLESRLDIFQRCDPKTKQRWVEKDTFLQQAKTISELYGKFS
jgi:hypothetical protein